MTKKAKPKSLTNKVKLHSKYYIEVKTQAIFFNNSRKN